MRIEEEIKQKRFANEWLKVSVNLTFTFGWSKTKLQTFFKGYGITMQQFNVLRILRGRNPESMASHEIRDRLLDKMSDISRIITRLEKESLVTRTRRNDDRRMVDIYITPKGQDLLTVIDQDMDTLYGFYKKLSLEEAQQLNALLDKLRG